MELGSKMQGILLGLGLARMVEDKTPSKKQKFFGPEECKEADPGLATIGAMGPAFTTVQKRLEFLGGFFSVKLGPPVEEPVSSFIY